MKNLFIVEIEKHMIDKCVDLFIETFTKEPWNDIYESKELQKKIMKNMKNILKF